MEHKQGAFVLLKIHWLCILFIYGQSSVNCGKGTKDSLTDTSHHPQDNQSDQMQRAVVLVHRRVPRDVNDRLQKLEIRVGEMARVLDMVRAQTDKLLRLENRMDELARKLNMATRNDSLQHLEDISRELDRMQKTINTQTDNLSRLENRMDELARTLNVAIRNDSLQHLEDISRQLDRMQKTFIAQTHKLWRLENRMDELARTLNVAIKNDSLQHLEHISRELDRMQKTVKAQTEKLSLLENRINVTTRNDRLQNLEDISRKLDHRLHLVNVENEKLKREMYFLKSCLKEQCKEDTCDKDNRECPSRPCPPQLCPTQDCAENVPGCPTHTCDKDNRECPSRPCTPQLCPTQNFAENALGCPTHTCDTGKRECPPQDCKEENLPGHCNEQTRSCTHSGVSYNHGDSWRSAESPCDICHCLDGYVRCKREQCYTPCRNPAAPPPNTCCPVCEGCDVNGHEVPNGAVIPVGDPCQECRCKNGNMVCSRVRCPAPSCHNPVHHAGECCPRCDQCEYESKVYGNGERFTSKRDPCLQCYCSAGEVFCINMSASCPTSHCTHSAKHRGECCATCNDCEYEQRVYANGEMFRIPGSGPCLHCRCKGGNIICHEKKCPPVHCSNPINHPHLCCPSC